MIVDPDVERYAHDHTTAHPAHLEELERETRAEMASSVMLTGRLEGRLLGTLVFLAGARRILEIGTFTGYSALSMATALGEAGRITTLEIDPERARFAQRHIDAAGFGDRVEIRVGPALESLRSLSGPFDLVFIDADKPAYPDYFDAALERLAQDGLIVLDNTLRGGEVLDPTDEGTRVIAALNDRLAADDRLTTVMLTVRDGVTLVRRRGDGREGEPDAAPRR